MKIETNRSNLSLALEGLVAIRDGQGTRIVCNVGSLWITQECDVKDSVITAGESFTVRNPGLTLLTALSASELSIIEPSTHARPEPWHPASSREQRSDPAVVA